MPLYRQIQISPPAISGRYYQGSMGTAAPAATVPTQSRLRVAPFYVWEHTSWDRIGANVTSAIAASTLRWAVYADSSGYPGTLLLDTGAAGDSSTTGWKEATISLTTPVGWYWVGVVPQGGAPTLTTSGSQIMQGLSLTSSEIVANSGNTVGYFLDSITAAAPSPFTAAAAVGGNWPMVWLRRT